jgi:hypothetical protein
MGWFFKKVRFECNACGNVVTIPLRRVHDFEMFVELEDGQALLMECHDCHQGVMIPGLYTKRSGRPVLVDPQNIDPDAPVFRL